MEQYYTCLTCISNGTWSLGSIVCKSCIYNHHHKNYIKEYDIKKTEENICDVCSKKITNNQISNMNIDEKYEFNIYSYCDRE